MTQTSKTTYVIVDWDAKEVTFLKSKDDVYELVGEYYNYGDFAYDVNVDTDDLELEIHQIASNGSIKKLKLEVQVKREIKDVTGNKTD